MLILTFLPIVFNNLPPIIGSFHFYAFLWIISLLLLKPGLFLKPVILHIIVIGILLTLIFPLVIWQKMDDWNLKALLYEFYYIFIANTIFWYFIVTNDHNGLNKVLKITFIFIIVTSILSIYSSKIDPLYARNITGGDFLYDKTDDIRNFGGGGYSFATSIVALFPILIYFYKNSQLFHYSKVFILSLGLLFFFTLIRVQFFANILLSTIIIVISFLGSKRIKISILLVSIFIIISIIIPANYYAKVLDSLSHYSNSTSDIHLKLNDMSDFLETGNMENTGIGGRASRYPDLFAGFIKAPILGTSFKNNNLYVSTGGHLFWMNKLAILGILGFLLYFHVYLFNITYNIRHFFKNTVVLFYYFLSISAIISLGLMKNLVGRETWIMCFFIIPGTFYSSLFFKK